MSLGKNFDKLCCIIVALMLVITELFAYGEVLGIETAVSAKSRYEQTLFDTAKVHTIDIVMEDWDGFLSTCENEEYAACTLVIDGEKYANVGIRAKGNTSLSSVSSMDSERYSIKVEFDHYEDAKNYYGLDKLCLNNIIQDNTYMKDYLTYRMMDAFGVAAPLCSYTYLTVNGEDFGLYLAVEAVEDSFLSRNYGSDTGELYKPDSMDMGGGRGNGMDFDFNEWEQSREENTKDRSSDSFGKDHTVPNTSGQGRGDFGNMPDFSGEGGLDFSKNGMPDLPGEESAFGEGFSFGGKDGFGGSDVALIYSDDAHDSYGNIFDNAKTDITDADKDRLIASLKQLNENQNIGEVVDVERVLRYFVVHNFVVNFDSYTGSMIHNYYLYEKDGQLSMIPWDYNLAFGGFMSGTDASSLVNYPIDDPVSGGTVESRPMLAWIFADEESTAQYHELFAAFLEEVDILSIIRETQALIAPYVKQDPTAFCSYEEFTQAVDTLYDFCELRIQSIKGQLDGSIGSTNETQTADQRIDASGIVISDMGSMGNMGGGMGRGEQMMQPDQSFGNGQTPFDPGQMQPPDRVQGQNQPTQTVPSKSTAGSILGLCGCAAVLVIGILFVTHYSRRKEG